MNPVSSDLLLAIDRYVEDLARMEGTNARNHTQMDIMNIRPIASGQFPNQNIPNTVYHPQGGQYWRVDYSMLHAWNSGLAYNNALQDYLKELNGKISDFQNRGAL